MEYDPYGYIIMEYNGSTVPTFTRETYSENCTLFDNETSRILNAQFSSDSMIDVKVSYSGSVRIVDSMLCLNSSRNNDSTGLAVMGGSSSRLESYYFILAYLPVLSLVIVSGYYFVNRKMLVKKLAKYRK